MKLLFRQVMYCAELTLVIGRMTEDALFDILPRHFLYSLLPYITTLQLISSIGFL